MLPVRLLRSKPLRLTTLSEFSELKEANFHFTVLKNRKR